MKNKTVSLTEWTEAQKEFGKREDDLKKQAAELAQARRDLPWVKVEKAYTFDTPEGKQTLADLFQGRPQLILQHFMFAPEWGEGCRGCSVQADTVDGARYHFEPKDVSFVAVSRAPVGKLEEFRRRMGWNFKWVSSGESDFNYDFGVSFKTGEMRDIPAVSVFYKNDAGEIFRTYFSYSNLDALLPVYGYLDLTPVGRDEKHMFDWIKHHDRYE